MTLETLACDLDGTLTETYGTLKPEIADMVQTFLDSGINVVILTDELEENIEGRLNSLRNKSNLHVFSDGGAVGFGFIDDKRTDYFKRMFSQTQFDEIDRIMKERLGEFTPEQDASRYRYGIQLKDGLSMSQLEALQSDLEKVGMFDSMTYIGRGILRFNPVGKHAALRFYLNRTKSTEENTMLIADQTSKYRSDWRLFRDFKKARRVHVGPQELKIDDDEVIFHGGRGEDSTLDYLRELKRRMVIESSFRGNERLYAQWIEDMRRRTGQDPELKIRLYAHRYPVLPEEQPIYILPFLKILKENDGVPVIMARSMLPITDIFSQPEPIIIKTASFEDMSKYNPRAMSRKDGIEGDIAFAITLNSLLGENAFDALNEEQKAIKDREGLTSNTLGGLIQQIGPECINKDYRHFLQRYYKADFYGTAIGFHNRRFSAKAFTERLAGLEENEKEEIRKKLSAYDNQMLDSWEKVWTVNQEAIRVFNAKAPNYRGRMVILRELLATTEIGKRYIGKTLVAIDDSQLTSRSAVFFRLIAEALSPGKNHIFGVFTKSPSYGQDNQADFVISEQLIFPEKELELYDGIYKLAERDDVWTYGYAENQLPADKGESPDLTKIREVLKKDYDAIERYMRKDSNLDPFEFIIFDCLVKDELVILALEEHFPNRNENPHFIDLGKRIIEFSRSILPVFRAKIDQYRSEQVEDPFAHINIESFRDYLHTQLLTEIKGKREEYRRRQKIGLDVVNKNRERIEQYFDNKIGFDSIRDALIAQIYGVNI